MLEWGPIPRDDLGQWWRTIDDFENFFQEAGDPPFDYWSELIDDWENDEDTWGGSNNGLNFKMNEMMNDTAAAGFEFALYFPPVQTSGKPLGQRGIFDVPALDPSQVFDDYLTDITGGWSPMRAWFERDVDDFFDERTPHPSQYILTYEDACPHCE